MAGKVRHGSWAPRTGGASHGLLVVLALLLPAMRPAAAQPDALLWPLDLKPALSSTFGETRATAFHAGIDLKTWGRTGYAVHAADDGWVLRARTSPWGYGRALYVQLADGRIAVYAHLESFAEPVAERILAAQRAAGTYSVQLWFEEGEIPVRRGQVIAHTGQSGAGPPHLHFEIRNAANVPLNPLLHGAGPVADTTPPTLRSLLIVPLGSEATVDGGFAPVRVSLAPSAMLNRLEATRAVHIWGPVGVAVDGYDRADLADNRLAPLEQALLVDGDTVWVSTYERVSYSDGHQVALDRVRPAFGGVYATLYRRPGNRLSFYRGVGDGVLWGGAVSTPAASCPTGLPLAPGSHSVEVVARDAAGNTTVAHLEFGVSAPPRIHGARLVRGVEGDWFLEADLVDADDERLSVSAEPVFEDDGPGGVRPPDTKGRGGDASGIQAGTAAGRGGHPRAPASLRTEAAVGGGPFTWRLPEVSVSMGTVTGWRLSVRDGAGGIERQALAVPRPIPAPTPFDLALDVTAGARHAVLTATAPRRLRAAPTIRVLGRACDTRQTADGLWEALVDLAGVGQDTVDVEVVGVAVDGGLGVGHLSVSGRLAQPERADTLSFLDGEALLVTAVGSAYEPLYVQAAPLTPEASPGLRATPLGCRLGPADAAFDRRARVALRVPDTESSARLGIYADDGEGRWVFLGADSLTTASASPGASAPPGASVSLGTSGEPVGDGGILYLSAEVRALGPFALMVDEVAPAITELQPAAGATVSAGATLSARIVDEGSGITREEDLILRLDGAPVIAEYDPEADRVTGLRGPLSPGDHRLTVTVRDAMANESTAQSDFRVR